MELEVSGYPSTPNGLKPEVWKLAKIANRIFEEKDTVTKQLKPLAYIESIEQLEQSLKICETALQAAQDPDISIHSSNPNQTVYEPFGNAMERANINRTAIQTAQRLAQRRSFIYNWVLQKHHELKFSGIANDVFSRIRKQVDSSIGKIVPDAVKRLVAIHENLRSDNAEDWSNAVHSCRRILQDLADAIFPPQKDDRIAIVDNKKLKIKLGQENYINRLIAFVEEKNTSERFNQIVGTHLHFLGDRLDAIFQASQKGSHATIVSNEEADRYVVYTYMIVGDILSLIQ
jgi:hypothetical protein